MLVKMLIHGIVAAAIIGSAAAVYAQTRDASFLAAAVAGSQGERHDRAHDHDHD